MSSYDAISLLVWAVVMVVGLGIIAWRLIFGRGA